MAKDILMREETVFKNDSMFELDYVPEHVLHRDSQMQTLKFNIQPALRGSRPVNTLCIGTVATGKTTSVRKIFHAVKEETQKVVPVYINCQVTSTKYTILSHLYKEIFGHMPPHSGVSFEKVFEKVTKNLVENGRVAVVALDDIQYLFREKEVDAVLYSLLRAHEVHEGAKIGVIAIYSGERMEYNFDPRVYSVFMPEEIRFERYGREQIKDILAYRVREGLYPNVVQEGVLDMVVDAVMSTGDLRMGIDLLKRAGMNAERRASRKISKEDVEGAYEKSRYAHLSSILKGLQKEEKILLRIICETQGKAGEIQEKFEKETKLGYTMFHEVLNKLASSGIIKLEFTGKGTKGRSRVPKLMYGAEEVLKRL